MLKSLAQLLVFVTASSSWLLAAHAQEERPSLCAQGAGEFDASVLNFSVVSTIEPLTPGFAILEGPTWYNGRLYMSHIGYSNGVDQAPSDIIVLGDDNVMRVYQNNSGTNGMVLTRRGEIVAAQHGRAGESGRVSLINLDNPEFEYTFTDEFDGVAYNSPNDVAVSSRYNVYFTDPDWQAPNGAADDGVGPPQAAERSYYLLRGDMDATPFGVGMIDKPNGVLLSADETQLYVGGLNGLFVFPISCSGSVRDEPVQLHADVIPQGVDGMTRDCAGNIYVTANGQVVVLDGETQDILTSVAVSGVTNLAFGGDDGTTLFATSLGETPTLYSSPSVISARRRLNLGGDANGTVYWKTAELLGAGLRGHWDITVESEPQFASTDLGASVEFDGVDDRLVVASNPIFGSEEFTIEATVFPFSNPELAPEPRFLHIESPDTGDRRITMELRVIEGGLWYFDAFIKSELNQFTLIDPNMTHPTEQWYHTAITYTTDGVFTTYINGVPELNTVDLNATVTYLPIAENARVSIGARINQRHYLSGQINSVLFTQRALTPEEFTIPDLITGENL